VSQISPPIRILLVCAVAFLGAYMLFLRPKDEVVPPATPAPNVQTGAPAQSGPGKAVEAAQGAVKASDGQLAQQQSVDGVDAGENAAGSQPGTTSSKSSGAHAAAAPAGKADVAGLPKPVAKAIRKGQVLVLLFWNGKSADDKAVHNALAKVDRWDGRVSVQSASIKKISKYGRVARGVDVEQSPTVVVADPELRAETLVGYVDTETIDQAVVDAARASGGLFTTGYLKRVNNMCSATAHDLYALPQPMTVTQARHDLRAWQGRWTHFVSAFQSLHAPAKWRSFKRATMADLHTVTASNARLIHALDGHSPRASLLRQARTEVSTLAAPAKRFNRRMDRTGLIFCGRNN
jgi:hypothetical protein